MQGSEPTAVGLPAGGVTVDRGALHRLLLDAVGDVRGGAEVAGVEDGALILAHGSRLEADRIVWADGLYSGIGARLDPGVRVVYSGQTCWRLLAPDPLGLPGPVERWGPGVRVGWTPLANRVLYGYLVSDAPAGTRRGRSSARRSVGCTTTSASSTGTAGAGAGWCSSGTRRTG